MQDTVDTYKLPVTRIFFEALQLPRRHAVALLRIGSPFLTVLLALAVVGSFLQDESSSPLNSWGAFTIIAIVFAATLVMAVVGCHRTFLLEAEDVAETKAVRWGGRETRFVGWWIVIGLCAGLIAIPLTMVFMPFLHHSTTASESPVFPRWVLLAVGLPSSYFASRWSLVLPAAATDKRHNLPWSWSLSRGNGIRLTSLVALLPFATDSVLGLLPAYDSLPYSLFTNAAWIVVGVIEVGLLSLSYQRLSRNAVEEGGISD